MKFVHGYSNGSLVIQSNIIKPQHMTQKENCTIIAQAHKRAISAMTANRDFLITSSNDGTVKLWSLINFELLHTIANKASVYGMHLQHHILYISTGQSIISYHVITGHVRYEKKFSMATHAIAMDRERLAVSLFSGSIVLLQVDEPEWPTICTLKGHQSQCMNMEFVNHETLVSLSVGNAVKIWNVDTMQCLHTVEGCSTVVLTSMMNKKDIVVKMASDLFRIDTVTFAKTKLKLAQEHAKLVMCAHATGSGLLFGGQDGFVCYGDNFNHWTVKVIANQNVRCVYCVMDIGPSTMIGNKLVKSQASKFFTDMLFIWIPKFIITL